MLEFKKPIPVNTPHGEGYAIYVQSSGMFENDCWTVCLCNGGEIKHYNTLQLTVIKNATFDIHEKEKSKKTTKDSDSLRTPNRKTTNRNR